MHHDMIMVLHDGEQRPQLFDLVYDPLLAVLVAAARVSVFPTQKSTAYAAVDSVVVRRVRKADQVATGLGHRGYRFWWFFLAMVG